MRWSKRHKGSALPTIPLKWAVLFFICIAMLALSAAPAERRLSVYSTAANYSVPIERLDGRDYVGLFELLDPLGTVSVRSDPPRWRIHYNNVLAEFVVGKSRVRIQGRDADLGGRFLLDSGRGLVPLDSLSSILPRLLGGPATLQEASGRLFIGSIATHFTAAVSPGDPSRLVFHFTAPVNPTVATEPGKLHLIFRREPVTAPASPRLTFNSKSISSAEYSEGDGAAEITVSSAIPLIANFSPDGRTITLSPAKSQTAANSAQPSTPAPGHAPPAITSAANLPTETSPVQPAIQPSVPSVASIPRKYFAVVDASHGGLDRGEALSPTLAEKDVTVAFARRLRQELESRGISTLVLRDSDANLSLDDRAFYTNNTHAAVYIALHAASNGQGVRLYTSMLPYVMGDDQGPFRLWNAAQSSAIPLSQETARSVASELKKLQVPVRTLTAPLRPLNNVLTAAIAVELAPPASDVAALTAPDYQQLIAGAVANGIVDIRLQLGAAP
jgi:N-acetylmuramoyl-L-alanine amidase